MAARLRDRYHALTSITYSFTASGASPMTGLGVALEGDVAAGGESCLANVQLAKN
jgi:hypothetical protein